jgi:hypothetical protein
MNGNYRFDAVQDWHFYFKELFTLVKIDSLLEFGMGKGTQFLLDNCNKVHSVELSIFDYTNNPWFHECELNLSSYKGWSNTFVHLPEDIIIANALAQSYQYPLPNNDHLPTLKKIIELFLEPQYDLIFIDPGIHNRGDIVNLSFGYAPIIAAHDTTKNSKISTANLYGYNIVNTPDDYECISFEDDRMGTTFWILKIYEDIIAKMKSFKA